MLLKKLNSFPNHWLVWGTIATLLIVLPLLNAWWGYPIPVGFNAHYSTIGGVIPYSDANGYFLGAHFFNDLGYLESWNMRRPLNALFLAFRFKITNYNFWYTMLIQAAFCATSLTIYLRTIQKDLGFLATLLSLAFVFYYAQSFAHSTLSEALGLTLGLLSFVLLWNGWLQRDPLTFNMGMVSLAVALNVRAGPNFIVPALFLLVYLDPFTPSRFKDVGWTIISFTIPFILLTKLSALFGDPAGSGMAFSNFGSTLYGLVNGGKTWTYAYENPYILSLTSGKNEAQEARILYEESWRIFKDSPLDLIMGLANNLRIFCLTFTQKLAFGTGIVKHLITAGLVFFWFVIGFRVYLQRHLFKREFSFLIVIFAGIFASASITWVDGGIRPYAVAIPFMGALLGLSFASLPTLVRRKVPETILATGIVAFVVLSSALSPFIPIRKDIPNISAIKAGRIPGQEIILIYNPNKLPHVHMDSSPGFHFRTISPTTLGKLSYIYEDTNLGKELKYIANEYNNNLVLLSIYDYISHSTKLVLVESNILNLDSEWLEIHVELVSKDFITIYRARSFIGLPQK